MGLRLDSIVCGHRLPVPAKLIGLVRPAGAIRRFAADLGTPLWDTRWSLAASRW